jgi:hypothetical protein
MDNLIKIIHKDCGKVAFYYSHVPKIGEIIYHYNATIIDDSHPKVGDPMVCGSCGKGITYLDLTCKENPV